MNDKALRFGQWDAGKKSSNGCGINLFCSRENMLQFLKSILYSFIFLGSFGLYSQESYHHYYGNLHAHTALSDGNKDKDSSGCDNPACSFEFAKTAEQFDFMGISEHNHSAAGMKSKESWHSGLAAAKAVTSPDFVALYGMEWGTISKGDTS